MARVVISERADGDVDEIFETTRLTAGYDSAVARNAAFDSFYRQITDFPESGAPRPELGPNIRIGVVRPHIIIYRYDLANDTALVLRVVHGRRDLTAKALQIS